jgi:hypothetical protein
MPFKMPLPIHLRIENTQIEVLSILQMVSKVKKYIDRLYRRGNGMTYCDALFGQGNYWNSRVGACAHSHFKREREFPFFKQMPRRIPGKFQTTMCAVRENWP